MAFHEQNVVGNDNQALKYNHDAPFGMAGEGEARNTSSSYFPLVSTLVTLLILSVPLFLAFLFLRVKLRRVYAPRTFIEVLHDEEKTPKLEKTGYINWMPEFWRRPDEEILDHQNLDGYLFIRFMKTISLICLVGLCLTIPLMIVNYKGKGKKKELASLTISNVKDPILYYFHCLIAAVFFGYVLYVITNETIYYINLRYAYFLTPRNAMRISSRTVLFTSVPRDWQNENWLRAEFEQIETIWTATNCKRLESLVKERDSTALNLEGAEVKLLSAAATKSTKAGVRSIDRPKTRTIPLIGQKQDDIESARKKLLVLIPKTKREQDSHLNLCGDVEHLPAVFIQFETQRAAQAAFQTRRQDQPGNIEPRSINTLPSDIIWENLGITRWSRLARTFIANTIIILLVLFWSIPTGLAGALTDLDSLVDDLPFLKFVNNIPVPILGAITGLLPALIISALLALVPIICRFLATQSGAVTLAEVELRTQSWYFAFQVVQVFLITTFSSGASAIAKQIFDDPTQAPSLLAENLPQASNFYLSYFMLQGITVAASQVFQVVPLLMFTVAGKFIDTTPRAKFQRWTTLSSLSWGDTYPRLTNLAVIALAYSCIAPLTLWFAAAGLGLLSLAFRYNVFYALSTAVDTKGDAYGRALQHLTVGIYLAEICLIGLFGAKGGSGPTTLMVLLLVITALYQFYLNLVLSPLLYSFTDKRLAEDEEDVRTAARMEAGESEPGHEAQPIASLIHDNLGTKNGLKQRTLSLHRERGGYFAPWLFHGSRSSYPRLRAYLASGFPGQPMPRIPEDDIKKAFLNPAITAEVPTLWIPRDKLGISKEQIKDLKAVIRVVDEGASFDGKGKVVWDENHLKDAPIWKERVDL